MTKDSEKFPNKKVLQAFILKIPKTQKHRLPFRYPNNRSKRIRNPFNLRENIIYECQRNRFQQVNISFRNIFNTTDSK